MFLEMFQFLFDIFMVFGPVSGFIYQLMKILKTKSSEGFSSYLCLILTTSNILRIYFWFGNRFSQALVLQSICMITVQVILLRYVIKYRMDSRFFNGFDFFDNFDDFLQHFWNCFFWGRFYFAFIGYLSLFLESSAGSFQVYKNYKRKSTEGVTLFLFLTWIIGDFIKFIYFIIDQSPYPFFVGCLFQIGNDLTCIFQYFHYNQENQQPFLIPNTKESKN
ncbi:pq-loop repeat-containing protein 1-like protein [Anaeramoeba ignava]|uniref:Pq-loop repeat-containing protein 1-like protein n=1 Tax=Anaeramoeba ignava TaxID=1746090 RepID=A0A9Q0RCB4_ANAIG|nr:pq-loop repeat-containing protein 1-like protein [Anaeramoeba ignava]